MKESEIYRLSEGRKTEGDNYVFCARIILWISRTLIRGIKKCMRNYTTYEDIEEETPGLNTVQLY